MPACVMITIIDNKKQATVAELLVVSNMPAAGIYPPGTPLSILRHGVFHVPWSLGDRLRPLLMEK